MKYVALLRGVNVGGQRRVPMAELRTVFTDMGFTDVQTYINSGNVIFCADTRLDIPSIESKLLEYFGFAIDVLVLTARQIVDIANAIPIQWANDAPNQKRAGQKSDVLYLFNEVDTPGVVADINYKPEIESMIYVKSAVLCNVLRRNQTKSSLLKLMGTPLYRRITIRNINTAKRLAELVAD